MGPIKNNELIERVYQKTKDGSLKWEKTAMANVFQVALPSATIEIRNEQSGFNDYYNMLIFNSDGVLVESINGDDITNEILGLSGYEILEKLYTSARSIALNVDKTIDELLKELDSSSPNAQDS